MTNPTETPWPTHQDGRPKKMGEMTPEERKAQFRDAVATVKSRIETPAMQQALREFLDGTADAAPKH